MGGRGRVPLLLLVCLIGVGSAAQQWSDTTPAPDLSFDGPLYEGHGAWSGESAKMDAAEAESRRAAEDFRGDGGTGRKVHRFCATAAPRCTRDAAIDLGKKKGVSAVVMAPKAKMARVSTQPAVQQEPVQQAERSFAVSKQEDLSSKAPSAPKKPASASAAHAGRQPVPVRGVGRWQGPLTRLKDRLADLEKELHDTEARRTAYRNGATHEMVKRLGRRLLASEEQPRSFPDSFYHTFGGLTQLEGVSEAVIQSVEGRVCRIYNSMCSSLAAFTDSSPPVPLHTERALWDDYRQHRRQKLQPRPNTGVWHRRRVAYPQQWRGLVTAAQAHGSTNLPRYFPSSQAQGPFYGARGRPFAASEVVHYPSDGLPRGYDTYGRPAAAPQPRPGGGGQGYYVRVSGEAAPGTARYARVDERQYHKIAKRMRRQMKRLAAAPSGTDHYQQRPLAGVDAITARALPMVQESGTDRYVYNKHVAPPAVNDAADGWGKTLAEAAQASGTARYEASPYRHPTLTPVAKRVHKKLHERLKAQGKDVHSEEAAMRGAGGGKLDEWPQGAWHSFSGIDETGADYPGDGKAGGAAVAAASAPHDDWPAVKWHSHGAKDVTKPSTYRPRGAKTHMLGGAAEGGEPVEVSDEEKEEWFYNWTKDYTPGSLGSPGLHEGQAYPAEYPKQEEDGSWQPDPGTGLGPKACIYMYAGPECGRGAIEGANYGLAAAVEDMPPIGSQQIKKIYSLHPSKVRGILWDDDENNPLGETMYFVIPSLHDYPRVPHNTKIDIREYVYTGHTVLMMGGVINIYLMNELFGWDLLPQYQPGPYLWNDRTAPGTPFEHVTRKVYEQVALAPPYTFAHTHHTTIAHAAIHVHTHARAHSGMHARTHTRAHTHTCTHTHTPR